MLQVWDIGGQSVSSRMLDKYIFGASVVFLCYDITDRQSFLDLDDWLQAVRRFDIDPITGLRNKPPKIYLIANKYDLIHLRKVEEADHQRFIRENCLVDGFFVSAQSGDSILTAFYSAAAQVIRNIRNICSSFFFLLTILLSYCLLFIIK